MTELELIKWAAKLIDYMHDKVDPTLTEECHNWFEKYWEYMKTS